MTSRATQLVLKVNGATHVVSAAAQTPLLYLLRNDLALNGPKFGCGLGECGACTVLLDGMATRACVTTAEVALGREITTLEGLGTRTALHPVQQAFIDEQAAQCGYCLNGMIMTAKALLDRDPHPTVATIQRELSRNLCRCGTHVEIVRAVQRAAQLLDAQTDADDGARV
ncbi:nicotinate dehydrogenase subunit A [Paraburkholderia sp. WSM4175]|uniref:(2Fe-2S)-binding protein n=1 Tax=Paraburkholderia sp. WSM4175 TaxID=2991072 RepID=UPI003D1FF78A